MPDLALIALMLAAGIVNGWTSLGFAMVSAAGLAVFVDPKLAVLLLAVTSPFISGVQVLTHRRAAPGWRRLVPLAIGAFAGVPIGAALLGVLNRDVIALLIGLMAVFFVISTFAGRGPQIPSSAQPVAGPLAGLLAGVSNGTVGVSGPVLGTYLLAIGLSPAAFGFSISVLFFSMGLVRIASLTLLDQLTLSVVVTGATLLVPALVGQQAGLWLHRVVSPQSARYAALVLIGIAGGSLILRALHVFAS